MSSLWKSITNGKSHNYRQVATSTSSPAVHEHRTGNKHKSNSLIPMNKKTTKIRNTIESTIENSESELDDSDFPEATNLIDAVSHSSISKQSRHPWADLQLSWWNHFSIGAYWFGWAFLWMPLLVIVIPNQVEYIVSGKESGKSMGTVFLIGSIGSLICSPVFGHLSDCSQNAMGRRRPFLMVGICVTTVGLLLMSLSPPYRIYCIGFFICSCGNFITLAPYSALVPDVVPYDQRGICSGWLGACSMFGYLLGGAMSYHLEKLGFFLTFVFLAMVHAFFGWITIKFVPEIHMKSDINYTHHQTNGSEMLENDKDPQFKHRISVSQVSSQHVQREHIGFFEKFPFLNMDFVWLFVSRFFIQMGAIIVQENLQYYLRDTKGGDFTVFGLLVAKDEVQAVSVLFAPLLFGGLISSIVSGIISDIYGQQRKFLVYFSGITMSVCCILFGLNRWFLFDIFISLFFGFGFGVFSAIDWAMATDVLPSPDCYGRDMGFWNLSMTMPQIIGSPLVGYLLDFFRKLHYIHLGWLCIFVFSACNFAIGTTLVKKIAHVK